MAKNYVIVRGRIQKMSDAALKIASRHFGAVRESAPTRHVPLELMKLPKKEDIIKAQPLADIPFIEVKKEPETPVTEKVADMQKATEQPVTEKITPKKTTRRPPAKAKK